LNGKHPELTAGALALDGMGGDNAPREVVLGALGAIPRLHRPIFLVGETNALMPFFPGGVVPDGIQIFEASQAVGMAEKPMDAYRDKKDSSLMVAANLVKDGRAAAMISAGNTGAAAVHALLVWGKIPGVRRPAIASLMPNAHDGFILMDVGASPDVGPESLVEFARMGRAYAQRMLGRKDPGVHLLNIGEEAGKGNAFVQEAFTSLSTLPYFRGNIEGKTMFAEPCDVVVCDAFVGNAVLKTAEGVAELITEILRAGVPTNPLVRPLYWPVKRVTQPLKEMMDYAAIGGSPLLGLNGVCIIAHGRSDARAIENALVQAEKMVDAGIIEVIREGAGTPVGSAA